MPNALNLLIRIILSVFFLIFPIFYLNFTFEPSEQSKLLLLIITTAFLLILNSLKIAFSRKINIIKSPYLLPLFLIASIYIISSFINSPNIFLTFITGQSTSTWLFLFIFFLLFQNQNNPKFRFFLSQMLVLGTALAGIYTILMYLGFTPLSVITPTGNLLSTALFFLIIIVFVVASLSLRFHFFPFFMLLIIIASEFTILLHLLADQRPILLPNSIGFSILSRVIQNPKAVLLGVGPANFLAAFTLGKPASINQTPIWNITFSSSSSFLTNMLSEAGIITGFIYIYIFISICYFLVKYPKLFPYHISLLILILLLAFLPASIAIMILLIVFLALACQSSEIRTINLHKLSFIIYAFPLLTFVLAALFSYLSIRAYLAEVYYRQSFYALDAQDGTDAYNKQKQAMKLNPYIDKYHLAIAQTSLLLADSLSKKENPAPVDLQKIPKLAQQAIEEGKLAVKLNKTNVFNWLNLSKIYASLASYAEGADKWAIEAARQAVILDPVNPNNYITLGQLYFDQDQFDNAEKYFLQALKLKNDLAKAHYQLGLVLIKKNNNEEARRHLDQALKLYPAASPEYIEVEEVLNSLL